MPDETTLALTDELTRARRLVVAYASLAGFSRGVLKALAYHELPEETRKALDSALHDVNEQLEVIESLQSE